MKKAIIIISFILTVPMTAMAEQWITVGGGIGKQFEFQELNIPEVPFTASYGRNVTEYFALQFNGEAILDFNTFVNVMLSIDLLYMPAPKTKEATFVPYFGGSVGVGYSRNAGYITHPITFALIPTFYNGYGAKMGVVGGVKFFYKSFVMGLEARVNIAFATGFELSGLNLNISDVNAIFSIGVVF